MGLFETLVFGGVLLAGVVSSVRWLSEPLSFADEILQRTFAIKLKMRELTQAISERNS